MSDQEQTEQTEQQSAWRRRELGALWVRDGKNQKYLSGHVSVETMPGVTEKVKVVVFTNKNKEKNERAPDYVVYRSEDPQSVSQETVDAAVEEAVKETVPADSEVPEDLF